MRPVLSKEDEERWPYLVMYDRDNPSPHFTPELIRYIESRQAGLSERDIAKLDEFEYFILNRHFGGLTGCSVPGLRAQPNIEARYVRRFNSDPYLKMINGFLDHVPPDFPNDQVDRCNLPNFRLTSPDGSQFYPIKFNGDLPAWRKRLDDNAKLHNTVIGHFEEGKFSVSDGNRMAFADLDAVWQRQTNDPSNF